MIRSFRSLPSSWFHTNRDINRSDNGMQMALNANLWPASATIDMKWSGGNLYFQHDFGRWKSKIRAEFNISHSQKQEDNHYPMYTGFHRRPSTYDNMRIYQNDNKNSSLSITAISWASIRHSKLAMRRFNNRDMNYLEHTSIRFTAIVTQ